MKAFLLFAGKGPMVVVTAREALTDSPVLRQLEAKQVRKFLAYELPLERVKERYGQHFNAVLNDPDQSDDLRVLEDDGGRALRQFRFDEFTDLSRPVVYEASGI